jgi:hypothetical protein
VMKNTVPGKSLILVRRDRVFRESVAKHPLCLIESKQSRSFALLRMTGSGAFFRSLLV